MMHELGHTPVVLTHDTALRGIRSARCRYARVPWRPLNAREQRRVLDATGARPSHIDRAELVRLGFLEHEDDVLHIAIASRNAHRSHPLLVQHVFAVDLPTASLLEVARDIYVMSPSMVFIQFASTHRFAETLALGFELCGDFSLVAEDDAGVGRARRLDRGQGYNEAEQALSTYHLGRFLEAAKRVRGLTTARQVHPHLLDHARSPMEAIMAALFHLSTARGGFGISNMKLNHRIMFNRRAQMVSGMPYAVCDAYVARASATLEYNGGDHDDTASRLHDERRDLGLEAMGVATYVVNQTQLRDIEALESVAQMLHKRQGTRYRPRGNGYRVRQVEVLNALRVFFGLRPC